MLNKYQLFAISLMYTHGEKMQREGFTQNDFFASLPNNFLGSGFIIYANILLFKK